jgi:hypothetical protein
MRPWGPIAASLCLALLGAAGCGQRPARTVAEAHERFRAAVAAGDPQALYRSLDQHSQWSVITIQRYFREVRAAVTDGHPAEARARELERTTGADLRRPEAFFAAQAARRGWMKRGVGGAAPASRIDEQGRVAVVHTAAGARFQFAYTEKGGWGWAGLQAELEELKRQASHDVDMARENARVYRGASGSATGGGGTGPAPAGGAR